MRQSRPQTLSAPRPIVSRRFLPVLLLLFVGSGCAALIYEIVWFQLLELVIGSSAVSLGVLLGTFMGGMCLGSLLLSRFVAPDRHPLRVYALLEAGIGVLGMIVLGAVPLMGGIYTATAMGGLAGILWRGLLCAVCLLPPTLLMGATLPAISRWVETTPEGISWIGFLYGGNIVGSVFGSLLAGFYLLRVHDMLTATIVAVAINIGVAAAALALSKRAAHDPIPRAVERESVTTRGSTGVYVAIGLSGLSALGAEVVWTRLLSLMLGASVYTFSIILAVFLIGLGAGSGAGSALARGRSPRAALGWSQLLLTSAIAWCAYTMARALPYWPINPMLSPSPWITFQVDLLRCLVAVFPSAFLWGAAFPLAIAAVVEPGRDAGRLVGRVYAANTVGAILGSILFSVVVIPRLGTLHAEELLIGVAIVAAVVALVPLIRVRQPVALTGRGGWREAERIGVGHAAAVGAGLIIAAVLARTVPNVPDGLIAYGRFLPTYSTQPKYLYVGEGMNSSIAVSEEASGVRNFHVAGKVEASTLPQDMRLQRMLGHISALLVKDPKSVLVVGFGAGVTAGAFVMHPGIKRIVICEIEPLIPEVVSTYFARENHDVTHDPRVQIVYDDARHYILTTKEKFDVITSDPIHPWVKGAATLYTKEYFELVKQHLNPGGVVTQWVPLYESLPDVVKSELATFFDVFPDGTVWSNDIQGKGYDVVLSGHAAPQQIDLDSIQRELSQPEYAGVAQSLGEVGFGSAMALFATYGGQARDLAPWLAGAQINRDSNLRLPYLAGMGLNTYQNASIYDDMLKYRRFPDGLFVGSEAAKQYLREAIDAWRAGP